MSRTFPFLRRLSAFLLLASMCCACTGSRQPLVNLALRKPAYHASSIDFNATAQLAVDGIIETAMPCWVEVCGDGGVPLGKYEHDIPFEPRQWTALPAEGPAAELSVRTHGFREAVDRITMTLAAVLPDGMRRTAYRAELQQLDEKGNWTAVRHFSGQYTGGRLTLAWDAPERTAPSGWRFTVEISEAEQIEWQEWRFYRAGKLLPMLTAEHFSSVWVSATAGQEWIAVDLGEDQRFRELRLHWLNGPADGVLQAGADSVSWRDLAAFGSSQAARSDTLHVRGRGRWVRLLLKRSTNDKPYILTELELLGPSDSSDKKSLGATKLSGTGQTLFLNEGWQLARLEQAEDADAWIPATVPGTVLVSHLDNGFLPDPNYGDNQQYISDSYFFAPFVYRCRFILPDGYCDGTADEHVRIRFDGINWKADVRLNGTAVGRIEGAFTDAAFDITSLLTEENLLEVTVFPPAHPGMTKSNTLERCATNGGVLGADNPTFHASVGWDWIPSIRGRNMGIWNDVRIERSGPVRILHPTATAAMPTLETIPPQVDTTRATVTLCATLVNDAGHPVKTTWEGSYGPVAFRKEVTLPAGAAVPMSEKLEIERPQLWWPNGYGNPHLYEVRMRAGGSDSLTFQSGIRQLNYSTADGNLRIWINGRRLVGRGGNWGFSESNLRYKASDYETAMMLHRHENFNIVRNWVGMTGDAEFYEAADRNGILVWQDFWLANPSDGPDPDDEAMFLQNAENTLLRIRHHPSLLLWCGRNEGYPPASLDQALRKLVHEGHPESFYLSSSADDYVSGRGPYNRLSPREYYRLSDIPGFRDESVKFHSERGMPNFPNYESLLMMMPAEQTWPPSRLWGVHDFALQSAQKGETFIAAVDSAFGPSHDAKTFSARAQWINYEGYRAMFESRSRHRRGLLLWMSHPAWPSMAFCTYDWFLDATASYYACRKACEPLHIQWNPEAERVEVVNYSAGNRCALRAVARLYSWQGVLLSQQEQVLDAPEDSTAGLFGLSFPGEVCILRLQLYEGESEISCNDYVLSGADGSLQALNSLPGATAEMEAGAMQADGWQEIQVRNTGEVPALMLHLVARSSGGTRILPTLWSDNYIHLMPGEQRTLRYRIPADIKGECITLSGFNLSRKVLYL